MFLILILFVAGGLFEQGAAQSYAGCDYGQTVTVGSSLPIYSPNYERGGYYPAGTFCRWTATTSPGYQLVLTCNEMGLPPSPNCNSDRIVTSRSGDQLLSDGQSSCGTTPFTVTSVSNQMVVALQTSTSSRGGYFRCDIYAVRANTCNCGSKKQTRIVGGTETVPNEYNYMAVLISNAQRAAYCGATIISPRYVLTAAHCVNTAGHTARDISILAGDHDYTTSSDTPYSALYPVESITQHPSYDGQKVSNDIALVRTTKPIVFNDGVGPVCLPFKYRNANFVGRQAVALGWGTTSFGGPVSTKLMKVALGIVDLQRCTNAYPNTITSNQICTFENGKDACSYDSGGPLLFSDPALVQFLIGITSFGTSCASSTPSVSTYVPQYLDWIQANTPDAVYCQK